MMQRENHNSRIFSPDLLYTTQQSIIGPEDVPIFILDPNRESPLLLDSSKREMTTTVIRRAGTDQIACTILNSPVSKEKQNPHSIHDPTTQDIYQSCRNGIQPSSKTTNSHRDWLIWRNAVFILFAVFFVIFIAMEFYYFSHPEINDDYVSGRVRVPMRKHIVDRTTMMQNDPYSSDQMDADSVDNLIWCRNYSQTHRGSGYIDGTQIKAVILHQDSNVFVEKIHEMPLTRRETVVRNGQNISFTLSPQHGLVLHVLLTQVSLLPEYTDVNYGHSDNGIVLDTSRRSNMQHWRVPLEKILNTKCRHPLPEQYYLAMHPYLDRHTTARRHVCLSRMAPPLMVTSISMPDSPQPLCPPGVSHRSAFFQRSVNGQCTQNKASFLPPQRNSIYCTSNSELVNTLFDEYITERQSYLKDPHCDTQRRLCQTCLRMSCEETQKPRSRGNNAPLLMDDTWTGSNATERIHRGEWIRDVAFETRNSEVNRCCGSKCYSGRSCLDYYGTACQRHTINHPNTKEVCLQGKTVKVTLNPDFQLANDSYMCHLEYSQPSSLYQVESWFVINDTWMSQPMEMTVSNPFVSSLEKRKWTAARAKETHSNERDTKGMVWLWEKKLRIEHISGFTPWAEGIVRSDGDSGQIDFFPMKRASQFGTELPEVQRHREEKYATVQFTRPFMHDTESWGNQSCQVNISDIHKSQPIYDERRGMRVTMPNPITRNGRGEFRYSFRSDSASVHLKLSLVKENHSSLLRTAFCKHKLGLSLKEQRRAGFGDHLASLLNQPGMRLKATNQIVSTDKPGHLPCQLVRTWRVTLTGWRTSHRPTFVHLTVLASLTHRPRGYSHRQRQSLDRILDENLLVFPSVTNSPISKADQFSLEFDVFLTTTTRRNDSPICVLFIRLEDCDHQYRLSTELDLKREATNTRSQVTAKSSTRDKVPNKVMTNMWSHGNHMYVPFLLVCTLFGLIYLTLLLVYAVVRFCRKRPHRSRTEVPLTRNCRTTPSVSVSSSTSLLSSFLGRPPGNEPLSNGRKFLIMIYLCFRVFYTFLFTISVGLSFLLSIESDAARQFAIATQGYGAPPRFSRRPQASSNDARTGVFDAIMRIPSHWPVEGSVETPAWMIEAARMEDFSQAELLRQVQSISGQLTECGEQHRLRSIGFGKLIAQASRDSREWMDPKRDTFRLHQPTVNREESLRSQRFDDSKSGSGGGGGAGRGRGIHNQTVPIWTSNPLESEYLTIDRQVWSLLETVSWWPYSEQVDGHLEKIRNYLDTSVIDLWTPFDRILNNLLISTWIAPARRALNATWFQASTEHVGQNGDYYNPHVDRSASGRTHQKQTREATALHMVSFMGVPQPAHARLTGARIWNSFRSLVPGLPNRFHYDVSHGESSQDGSGSNRAGLNARYLDQRFMLSNDDWLHLPGGFLGSYVNTAYQNLQHIGRYQQHPNGHILRTSSDRTGSWSYLLSLTQIRLILLLLDAIIIVARCYQTYRFMQHIWFGQVDRISLTQVTTATDCSPARGVGRSPDVSGLYDSMVSNRTTATGADEPILVELPKSSTRNACSPWTEEVPHSLKSDAASTMLRPSMTSVEWQPARNQQRQSNHGPQAAMVFRSGDLAGTDAVDGSAGRLTACYCCMDAHYLLLILGFGILLVGLVMLWVTDRNVRPSWLLVRTGVYARSKAMEECRIRTNSILMEYQPNYWNKLSIQHARRIANKETVWMQHLMRRFHHEQIQVHQTYLTELCTIDRARTRSTSARLMGKESHVNSVQHSTVTRPAATSLFAPSSCVLLDTDMHLSTRVRQFLSPHNQHQSGMATDPTVLQHGSRLLDDSPICMFTPIVPATYAEGYSSRLLRMLTTQTNGQSNGLGQPSLPNRSGIPRGANWDEPPDNASSPASFGSVATLIHACHRLMLTGLTVLMAMGGLLACLHLVKLLAKRILSRRTSKAQSGGAVLRISFTYSNPNSLLDDGKDCDRYTNKHCDVYFSLCLQNAATSAQSRSSDCRLLMYTSKTYDNSVYLEFINENAKDVQIAQPVPNAYSFRMEIWDSDYSNDERISSLLADDINLLPNGQIKLVPMKNQNANAKNKDLEIKVFMSLTCNPDYYGIHCMTHCETIPDRNTCDKNGKKICNKGLTGPNCEKENSCFYESCAPHARCENRADGIGRICHCNGNQGPECYPGFDPCSTMPCNHGGTCHTEGAFNESFLCNCTEAWMGHRCTDRRLACEEALQDLWSSNNQSITIDSSNLENVTTNPTSVCLNGGQCLEFSDKFAYQCNCLEEWTGEHCELRNDGVGTHSILMITLISVVSIFLFILVLLLLVGLVLRQRKTKQNEAYQDTSGQIVYYLNDRDSSCTVASTLGSPRHFSNGIYGQSGPQRSVYVTSSTSPGSRQNDVYDECDPLGLYSRTGIYGGSVGKNGTQTPFLASGNETLALEDSAPPLPERPTNLSLSTSPRDSIGRSPLYGMKIPYTRMDSVRSLLSEPEERQRPIVYQAPGTFSKSSRSQL